MITDTRVTLDPAELRQMKLAARKRGLHYKDIARELGINPRMLAKYACGERRPTDTVLEAWRRVLGIRQTLSKKD